MMPLLAIVLTTLAAAPSTTPVDLRTYTNLHTVGFEWDIEGDTNHNATCTVRFRAKGAAEWRDAFDLMRVDIAGWYQNFQPDRAYNMLAGSILFLEPATTYEVELSLVDPDGGDVKRNVELTTRPVPTQPTGRRIDVTPDTLVAAQQTAKPGDVLLLHAGDYGQINVETSGEPHRHIAYVAADENVTVSHINMRASWIYIEGIHFQRGKEHNAGIYGSDHTSNVAVVHCDFKGYKYGILLAEYTPSDWYIADNTIVGTIDDPHARNPVDCEGVELRHSSGHTVCYNRMSNLMDGVSYPVRNCDIFNNDIRDIGDDGIEMDFGYANNRAWSNRMLVTDDQGFSFQPQYAGPWYMIRNEVFSTKNIAKFRVMSRFVMANNTFIVHGEVVQRNADGLLRGVVRNNLWIFLPSPNARPNKRKLMNAGSYSRETNQASIAAFQPQPDWRTDVDYDGFDWPDGVPFASWTFDGNGKAYFDLETFAADMHIWQHARRVHHKDIFTVDDILTYADTAWSPKRLTLREGCNAIDAGRPLANLVEDYLGANPDLGAHEFGMPLTHYGPRER